MIVSISSSIRAAGGQLALIVAGAGSLLGCATNRDYPSLAPRAVEDSTQTTESASAAPSLAADRALDGRVASLFAQAASSHAAFEKAAREGCVTIVRGAKAAQGSEAWIAAQQAISSLDAARAPVQTATAELDQLTIDRSTNAGPAVDLSRLAAAQDLASRLDIAEQATMKAISAGDCAR